MPISKIKTSSITADAASVNLNIDAGTLFLDVANNAAGIGTGSSVVSASRLTLNSGSFASLWSRNDPTLGYSQFYFGNEPTNASPQSGYQFLRADGRSSGWIALGTSDVVRLHVDSTGNVGIGTTSPTSKLHISGASDPRIIIYETGAAPYTSTIQLASQSLANYGSIIQYSSDAEVLYIQNYGRSNASTAQGSIRFQTKLGNSAIGTALTINGATGTLQKQLTGDAIAYQLRGSYTNNPVIVEYGQASSDGYLTVKDAAGNTSYISGYPAGTSYFSSNLAVGATSIGSTAAKFSVADSSSHSSGIRNHSSFIMPNMTGGSLSIGLGKAGSTRNLGKIMYNHAGDSNTSNSVGIGFWDLDNVLVTYANGSVFIGDSTPVLAGGSNRLYVTNWTAGANGIIGAVNRQGVYHAAYISASNPGFDWQFGKGAQTNNSTDFEWGTNGGGGTVLFRITSGGNITAAGSVNGTSKNFVIDHPLPELKDTHYLVHTSTESPTADLIYRGKVNLVAGRAEINIDTESAMTDGTFEAMVHNVQCFTSNESDWVHVRGRVEGNILSIEAQDLTATSLISWMVIGERKDEAMKLAEHTDENGKIIVEPAKELLSYDASKDPMNPESPDYDPTLKPIPPQEEQQPYPDEEIAPTETE